jgi:hypothetical protein
MGAYQVCKKTYMHTCMYMYMYVYMYVSTVHVHAHACTRMYNVCTLLYECNCTMYLQLLLCFLDQLFILATFLLKFSLPFL